MTCNLSPEDHAEQLHQAFQDGYEAGRKAPRGITNPCPGGGKAPRADSIYNPSVGDLPWARRGVCVICGHDSKLTAAGKIRKHASKPAAVWDIRRNCRG